MALPSLPDYRLSNSLTAIADDLRRANDAAEQAERDAVTHALEAGRLLCEAKEQCQHGQWLPFLARSEVNERKAQRLMKLHRGRLQSDTVSELGGVSPALTFLSLRDNAMRCLKEAEKCAIRFEITDDEEDRVGVVRSMELALGYIDAMLCCFPADSVTGRARDLRGTTFASTANDAADALISAQQAAEDRG